MLSGLFEPEFRILLWIPGKSPRSLLIWGNINKQIKMSKGSKKAPIKSLFYEEVSKETTATPNILNLEKGRKQFKLLSSPCL